MFTLPSKIFQRMLNNRYFETPEHKQGYCKPDQKYNSCQNHCINSPEIEHNCYGNRSDNGMENLPSYFGFHIYNLEALLLINSRLSLMFLLLLNFLTIRFSCFILFLLRAFAFFDIKGIALTILSTIETSAFLAVLLNGFKSIEQNSKE